MQEDKSFYRYKDYFSKAGEDFSDAEDQLEEENLALACAHLQEAVGKYMTGYAFYKAESVKEIQEIGQLFSEAESCNNIFEKFQLLHEVMKKHWPDDEYPVLMASKLDKKELGQILEDTKELVKSIMEEIEK
ncbi:MAG: HEPN domain-containing protein [bacterium]|nr:HEPN domain-containing protein [bacterium]